jgi:hypothetical protein
MTPLLSVADRARIVMAVLDALPRAVAGTINFTDECLSTQEIFQVRDQTKAKGEQWTIWWIRGTKGWNGMTHEAGASTRYQGSKRYRRDHNQRLPRW